MKRNKA
jgi:hypothetical protein